MDISVIIPAYNAEKYLNKALESAVNQDFKGSYEILIADDVSTDNTKQLIENWHYKYPNLIKPIFRSVNLGCSENSYQLCINSTAKYLAFLDSDDFWTIPNKLQIQFDYLENHRDMGMLCSNAYIYKENKTDTRYSNNQSGPVLF